MAEADAKWELVDTFRTSFPDYQLEDELFLVYGRDVMVGQMYQRCKRQLG